MENIPIFRENIIFFIKLTKVLEVVNFRFLANFRYLTLIVLPLTHLSQKRRGKAII